jgi:hypothetical protein
MFSRINPIFAFADVSKADKCKKCKNRKDWKCSIYDCKEYNRFEQIKTEE